MAGHTGMKAQPTDTLLLSKRAALSEGFCYHLDFILGAGGHTASLEDLR